MKSDFIPFQHSFSILKTAAFSAIFSCFFANSLEGQRLANMSFYRQNWELINPAAIDRWQFWDDKNHQTKNLTVSGRRAFFDPGFGDLPWFLMGAFEWSPENDKDWKLGGTLFYDETGPLNTLGGNFAASVQLKPMGDRDDVVLSCGLGANFLNYGVNGSKLNSADKDTDPVLQAWLNGNHFQWDVSAGLFLNVEKNFYLGLSAPQIVESRWDGGESLKKKISPHVYLTAGKFFAPSGYVEEDGFWEFSSVARYVHKLNYTNFPRRASMEGNARYWFVWGNGKGYKSEKLWLGAGVSTNRTLQGEIGFEWRKDIQGSRNKFWRDRCGASISTPWNNRSSYLGIQLELTYSHSWY